MEDSYKPIVQPQRRLNPVMQEVVKKEIVKLLAAGVIYPISDSPWDGESVLVTDVSMMPLEKIITLPFIDQMLERIAGYSFYCFLDGYSGYNQIPIAPEDQDKTTFTYPHGTYAYRRMPFGLCNAPATFQRCMSAIFSDMTEKFLETCVDDFTLFGKTFEDCLHHLTLVLKRCEETNLILGKCHFMTVHKRLFKGFKTIDYLLMKDIKFDFPDDYLKVFENLKKKLSTAPVVVSPDWNQPFEVMCDASDTAAGAVLGQRKDKIFRPIYYASRTMNEAQLNYGTTERELLAIVFAFDKFRSYLIGTKILQTTWLESGHPKISLTSKEKSLYLMQNNVIRRCVPEEEVNKILYHCHDGAIGGHYAANQTTFKVLEAGFFWSTLFKDAQEYVAQCDRCQRTGNITMRDEMPLQSIQVTIQPEHLMKASIKTESPTQEQLHGDRSRYLISSSQADRRGGDSRLDSSVLVGLLYAVPYIKAAGATVSSPQSRRSLQALWAQVVRGDGDEVEAASVSSPRSPSPLPPIAVVTPKKISISDDCSAAQKSSPENSNSDALPKSSDMLPETGETRELLVSINLSEIQKTKKASFLQLLYYISGGKMDKRK
ncbi:PREDICTED: uncharacterized protein K02A2.6-like [Nicotiana attenuata]|uniref:uncharacterized protein K02A2.6-like n=1 Tax=Nicotiana attenuata TaxID=49451 RepID=UPI0009055F56|nr:PREDICTED: uncharacterized protein K02A2.6-like [Nicotiana attenuata]